MAKPKLFTRKFRNWLLHLVVSRQDLKSIVGYTLTALKQDGARWQEKIDLLQPLYDTFDAGLVGHAGAGAGQRSHTLQADTVFRLIKQLMKKAYKINFAALEVTNPVLYRKFFPEGRTQFSGANRQTMGTVFPTFVQTLTANVAAVPGGAALLADAQQLATNWQEARRVQDVRKKQVKTTSTTLDADETDLLIELFGAYATLLAAFYRTPERALDYFDFSVLPASQRQSEADAPADSPADTPTA
ncbi:MAG: hypothetical protein H7330_07810 [Hymenobacteraceae bacterium]|nr:hypothetical protein [Hymenobacteraceae bacterium]